MEKGSPMPRSVRFEVVTDTAQFTYLQIQPKSLLALCWNGYARWLKEHLFSFPTLIRDHHFGTVILSIDIEYLESLQFFDTDTIEVEVAVRVRRGGSRLELEAHFFGAEREAAQVLIVLCPVEIQDAETLTAAPAKLPDQLLEKFHSDEIDDGSPARQMPALLEQIAHPERLLVQGKAPFVIHHHYCEVAEQWSFIEVPNIVESVREAVALEHHEEHPLLRQCLNRPRRQINIELSRPYFIYESGLVASKIYQQQDRPALVHQLLSGRFDGEVHGTVVEQY